MSKKSLFVQVASLSTSQLVEQLTKAGADPNIQNLTLTSIADMSGNLYVEKLDAIRPLFAQFNNLFVGSQLLPWGGAGNAYREGISDPTFRWANLGLQAKVWRAFTVRYPGMVWHFYIEYEAPLDYLTDGALRSLYEAYLIQSIRDSRLVAVGRAILWSPAFWRARPQSGLQAKLTSMFTRVKAYASPGITWLDLQDMQGRAWMQFSYDDVKAWYDTLRAAYQFASLRINEEMFEAPTFSPSDPVELAARDAFYARNGMPIGHCWELRYWFQLQAPPAPVPVPSLKIVSPATWGAIKPYDAWSYGPWSVDKWVIHYGGGSLMGAYDGLAREQAVLQAWERYHVYNRGWRGIAYNYAIGMSGTVYRLRGENHAGATSGDYEPDGIPENAEARAVVFIMGGDQVPSEAAKASFKQLYTLLGDGLLVIGHSDVRGLRYTACPGTHLREWLRSEF